MPVSSWYSLLDSLKEARKFHEEDASNPPTSCPNDGEPLTVMSDGTRHCQYDGYIWEQ